MEFPRLVFLVASLAVLTFVVSGFTIYHIYLALTNQTTNERYKKYALQNKGDVHPDNPYHSGLWQNLLEELWPLSTSRSCKSSHTLGSTGTKHLPSHRHITNARAKKRR